MPDPKDPRVGAGTALLGGPTVSDQRPICLAQVVADGAPGGGTTMVLGLIDDILALGGFEITVISQPGSYLEGLTLARGLPFIGVDFFTGMADVRLPWRLARSVGNRHFDISHLHGIRAAHHAVRWPVRGGLGHLLYTVHGLHQLHAPAWLRFLANLADRQVMQRVGETVFVSQADQALAQQWRLLPIAGRWRVIPNGIDMKLASIGIKQVRSLDVVFVGRHVEQKGPLAAARALATLAAMGYRCAMAGDGPLRTECEALLASLPGGASVACLGQLTHPQTLALLSSSRVLMMTSLWEGLPILPIEAAARGVAVVAHRISGLTEVVIDDVTGLLSAPGDTQALVRDAVLLLSDAVRLARHSDAARTRALQHFDRQVSSKEYAAAYRRALARK